MLRNSILSVNQVIKLDFCTKLAFQSNVQTIHLPLNHNPCNHYKKLTFTLKYGFFKNEVSVDYKKNYYEILQVKESATLMQIKKSFYKLAKQSHPDTSKGNQELFKSINEAYNVLSHQERRKLYDVNRVRKDENPNDVKAQAQRYPTHEQRQSTGEQDYKNSQQFAQRKQEAYYHYSRGQWQQFRSGYKYHNSPENDYFNNMTNNVSSDKLYQTMKKKHIKQTQSDEVFLSEMEQYFAYLEKVRLKKQKDINDYHAKLQQMEKQLFEERKARFRKTFIGKGFTKVQNAFSKVSDFFSRFSNRSSNADEKSK